MLKPECSVESSTVEAGGARESLQAVAPSTVPFSFASSSAAVSQKVDAPTPGTDKAEDFAELMRMTWSQSADQRHRLKPPEIAGDEVLPQPQMVTPPASSCSSSGSGSVGAAYIYRYGGAHAVSDLGTAGAGSQSSATKREYSVQSAERRREEELDPTLQESTAPCVDQGNGFSSVASEMAPPLPPLPPPLPVSQASTPARCNVPKIFAVGASPWGGEFRAGKVPAAATDKYVKDLPSPSPSPSSRKPTFARPRSGDAGASVRRSGRGSTAAPHHAASSTTGAVHIGDDDTLPSSHGEGTVRAQARGAAPSGEPVVDHERASCSCSASSSSSSSAKSGATRRCRVALRAPSAVGAGAAGTGLLGSEKPPSLPVGASVVIEASDAARPAHSGAADGSSPAAAAPEAADAICSDEGEGDAPTALEDPPAGCGISATEWGTLSATVRRGIAKRTAELSALRKAAAAARVERRSLLARLESRISVPEGVKGATGSSEFAEAVVVGQGRGRSCEVRFGAGPLWIAAATQQEGGENLLRCGCCVMRFLGARKIFVFFFFCFKHMKGRERGRKERREEGR